MASTISTSTDKLKVRLDYYTKHEDLLNQGIYKTFGTAAKVKGFQKSGEIDLPDFLNYLFIHRYENPKYETYAKRVIEIYKAALLLEDVIEIGESLNYRSGSDGLQQRIGEAVGLSVAGKLFGLTAADWDVIPVERYKAFDFERVMTGITTSNSVVQIEVKGTFVNDNTVYDDKVSAQASGIAKKKRSIAKAGSSYARPAAVRYGMITSIDPKNKARCFLLDPPGDVFDGEPRNHKIANRLDYVAQLVSLLAPRATLPEALVMRANRWRAGNPLPSSEYLESLAGYHFTADNYVEDFLARGKVFVKTLDVVGQLFKGPSGRTFFLGLKGDVVRTAIRQNPEVIAQQSFQPASLRTAIRGQARLIGSDSKDDSRQYRMTLHTASSGVVIGLSVKS